MPYPRRTPGRPFSRLAPEKSMLSPALESVEPRAAPAAGRRAMRQGEQHNRAMPRAPVWRQRARAGSARPRDRGAGCAPWRVLRWRSTGRASQRGQGVACPWRGPGRRVRRGPGRRVRLRASWRAGSSSAAGFQSAPYGFQCASPGAERACSSRPHRCSSRPHRDRTMQCALCCKRSLRSFPARTLGQSPTPLETGRCGLLPGRYLAPSARP